jgi:hypothetical protein
VSKKWVDLSENDRIKKISNYLSVNILYKHFKIIKAPNNGQIVLKIQNQIPANKRAIILLGFEEILKKKIDPGITIWCEAVADKSKLRKLRGVTVIS